MSIRPQDLLHNKKDLSKIKEFEDISLENITIDDLIFNGKNYDIKFNGSISEAKKTYMVNLEPYTKFILNSNKDAIAVGDSGLVCLMSDLVENTLSITNKAVYTEGVGKNYVYRVKDGKKEKVYVEIGVKSVIYTQIISGLEEGDVVINE